MHSYDQRKDDVPDLLRWLLISVKEVGFPVAVAIYLAWFTAVTMSKHTDAIKDMTTAMQKNTEVLKLISHKLKVGTDGG